MAVNENSNKKIVFTSKKQVFQFLIDHPDNLIFGGREFIVIAEPNLDEFWERYGEKEITIDVPSFRKWFYQAGLELEIEVEMRWYYKEARSGLYSCVLSEGGLGDKEGDEKPFDSLLYPFEGPFGNHLDWVSMKMKTDYDYGAPDRQWELDLKSCIFFLSDSADEIRNWKSNLEEHGEAA